MLWRRPLDTRDSFLSSQRRPKPLETRLRDALPKFTTEFQILQVGSQAPDLSAAALREAASNDSIVIGVFGFFNEVSKVSRGFLRLSDSRSRRSVF